MAGFNLHSVGFVALLRPGAPAPPPADTVGAILLTGSNLGYLNIEDGIAGRRPPIVFGDSWSLELKLRRTGPARADYIAGTPNFTGFNIIRDYVAGTIEFYDNTNYVRFPMATPLPGNEYNTLKLTYDKGTGAMAWYLNGALNATATIANYTPAPISNSTFSLGYSGTPDGGGYALLKLTTAGSGVAINLDFNDVTGGTTNLGTAGGEMTYTTPPPRETV